MWVLLCVPGYPPTDTNPVPAVSPEDRERYTEVIDSILAKSDLNTVSEKRIRTGLQEVVGYDLTPQKVCSEPPCRRSTDAVIQVSNAVWPGANVGFSGRC